VRAAIGDAMMAVVCLSVPYLTLRRERKGVASWKLPGDPWLNLEVERSKVKVTSPLNAVTENRSHFRNGKAKFYL